MKKIIYQIKNSNILKDITEVKLVGKGGFSDCFILTANKKKYVLKIRRDEKVERLRREYNLLSQKVLEKYNLAPKAYKFDNSRKLLSYPYLLEEYIEGTHPNKKVDFWFIDLMAHWYKRLHRISRKKLEAVEVKRINSISFWIDNMKERAKKINFPSKEIEKQHKEYFEKMTAIAKENNTILKRKIYNFIQCDPSRGNVFIQKDKTLKLIDWDFAGYHIFERDLALFVDCYNLNHIQESRLLHSYGIKTDKKFMKKFNVLKLILISSDINWLLRERKNEIVKVNNKMKKGLKLMEIIK